MCYLLLYLGMYLSRYGESLVTKLLLDSVGIQLNSAKIIWKKKQPAHLRLLWSLPCLWWCLFFAWVEQENNSSAKNAKLNALLKRIVGISLFRWSISSVVSLADYCNLYSLTGSTIIRILDHECHHTSCCISPKLPSLHIAEQRDNWNHFCLRMCERCCSEANSCVG